MKVLVSGGAGFIAGHLIKSLLDEGHEVRAVDIRPFAEWKQFHPEAENRRGDLSILEECWSAVRDCDTVYHLAADTGGMGYIAYHRADCMLNVLIDTHMLLAARDERVRRFYFASTSCVYPNHLQTVPDPPPLAEADAWPADPEPGYGLTKLHTEQMCKFFAEDYDLDGIRIGRHQSIYGEAGHYDGGREKAPTAICRKIATAKLAGSHEIEVWGDGQQTRNFIYISDATDAILAITASGCDQPLNLGSPEATSIAELVAITSEIAGWPVTCRQVDGPEGVRGRSSDMSAVFAATGWKPQVSVRDGMERTYRWTYDQIKAGRRL